MPRSTPFGLLSILFFVGCFTSSYVPAHSRLLREERSLRLYETPDGFMVVLTRQGVDPGNEICEFDDQEQAIEYFENEAAGRPEFVECVRYGWEVPKSQQK